MRHRVWRRFRPRRKLSLPEGVVGAEKDIFVNAINDLNKYFHGVRRIDNNTLDKAIYAYKQRAQHSDAPSDWLCALVVQGPRAVRAQEQMDNHPSGYHDKQTRLYELIDFNDTYVSLVLSLHDKQLINFAEKLKSLLDSFCKRARSVHFNEEQYSAITRGLSREIAVYRGAVDLGYSVRMTSRTEDALGVDMVITDPETHRQLNVDCKTASSFRYRLQDLVREGRIDGETADRAEENGYEYNVNGHNNSAVRVTLMRVDANELGEIVDFRFQELDKLKERIQVMFRSDVQ